MNAQVQRGMYLVRPHYLALWISGFISGAVWPFSQGPTTTELHLLTTELRTTRVVLEENQDSGCRADLHSEIRYSTGLRVVLQGATVLQLALYLWVCCQPCRRHRRLEDRPVDPKPETSSSESDSVVPPVVQERKGPVRPSDLKKYHGRSK